MQNAERTHGAGAPVAVLNQARPDPRQVRVDADAVEAELRATARSNADARAAIVRRKEKRGRVERIIVSALLLCCALWMADNVIGFITTPKATAVVHASGDRHLAKHYVVKSHARQTTDCWYAGSKERVWKAAAPFGWVVPYRCGESAALVFVPGLLSALVTGFGVMCALGLVIVYRRRAREWY